MNNFNSISQDTLLANQIINLFKFKYDNNDHDIPFTYFKDGQEFTKNIDINLAIKDLLEKVNPFSFAIFPESSKQLNLLLIELISICYNNEELDPLLNQITKENMAQIPHSRLLEIVTEASRSNFFNVVKTIFNNGFKIQQGVDEDALEFEMAKSGYNEFFEILAKHQPDFNYFKKYNTTEDETLTLSEVANKKYNKHNNKKIKDTYYLLLDLEKRQQHKELSSKLPSENNLLKKLKI